MSFLCQINRLVIFLIQKTNELLLNFVFVFYQNYPTRKYYLKIPYERQPQYELPYFLNK